MCIRDRADKQWIGQQVFSKKDQLSYPLKDWYYAPTVSASFKKPELSHYFLRNFFLWMPANMWEAKFTCPICSKPLRKHGIYFNVRRVLDVSCYYYIATEHLDCICGKSFQSWDSRLLSQLPYGTQLKFPAVLTYKYAVDKNLLIDLRARTLGNSPTSIHTLINLKHSDSYIKRSVMYLEDVKRHQAALKIHCCPAVTYSEVPPMTPVPTPKWFLLSLIHN